MATRLTEIPLPDQNWHGVDDTVLAQSVAGDASWLLDDHGNVYDDAWHPLGATLAELAPVMRGLGWFTPQDAKVTGVVWDEVPHWGADRAGVLRHELRRESRQR